MLAPSLMQRTRPNGTAIGRQLPLHLKLSHATPRHLIGKRRQNVLEKSLNLSRQPHRMHRLNLGNFALA